MELVSGAGPGKGKALVIANACDLLPEPDRKFRVERERAELESLGFLTEELDLRRHLPGGGDEAGLRSLLSAASLVWSRGGNAFVLLRAMRQSGFVAPLLDALASDALAYGGYSGGIAVLAPTLRGIEIVNDPLAVPPGLDPETPWEGLGLIPFNVAPHYKSPHPASPGIDEVVRYFEDHAMPYKTLRDGEAWIRSGEREELLS